MPLNGSTTHCQWMQEACPERVQEAPRQGGPAGTLGDVQEVWDRV